MSGASYPAARAVAERIQARLATHPIAYQSPGDAPKPDAVAIEEIVSAAFWASLRREEGRAPKISLAFVPPEQSTEPLLFERQLPLEPDVLSRLAPAVERPGIHLGVSWFGGRLALWGTTRLLPAWCLVLEVVSPGLLVVKYRRPEPTMKFGNVAVLEGATVKFVEQDGATVSDGPAVLTSLLAFYSSAGRKESDNILVRLGISMLAHGRGGSLLVVPRGNETWRESIVHPLIYSVQPPSDVLRGSVDALAGLTAVDGATVISDHLDVLAFGAKIMPRIGAPRVEQILVTEPIQGAAEVVMDPSQWGGTRHLSGAQFVYDQRSAVALVASQDGKFTVFAWSETHQVVRAHRLDALLM